MRIINSLKDSMIIMLIILCIIFTMNFLDITNGFNNFTDNISRFTIIHIFIGSLRIAGHDHHALPYLLLAGSDAPSQIEVSCLFLLAIGLSLRTLRFSGRVGRLRSRSASRPTRKARWVPRSSRGHRAVTSPDHRTRSRLRASTQCNGAIVAYASRCARGLRRRCGAWRCRRSWP